MTSSLVVPVVVVMSLETTAAIFAVIGYVINVMGAMELIGMFALLGFIMIIVFGLILHGDDVNGSR